MRWRLPLFLAACLAAATGCGNHALDHAQRVALQEIGAQLPRPYRDGLVVESVHRDGDELVLVIRSAEITVAMAKARPAVFDALRDDEQAAMQALCADPLFAPLHAAGGGVRRHFVDADGAVFFDATLKASDCLSP